MKNTPLNIIDWFNEALSSVEPSNPVQDIHVDEIIGQKYKTLNKSDILKASCTLFYQLITHLVEERINTHGFDIWLHIDLVGDSNKFTGKPGSYTEIENLLDIYSVPEIIVYQNVHSSTIPLNEFYRVPVAYKSPIENPHIQFIYKEHRDFNDIINNGDYRRELNIIYIGLPVHV